MCNFFPVCWNFLGDLLACQAFPYSREHFGFSLVRSPLSAFMSVLMLYCKLNCRFPGAIFSAPGEEKKRAATEYGDT